MAKHQVSFFATKSDLESLLRAIESSRKLVFVKTGLFDSPSIEPIYSLLTVSDLGCMNVGDQNQSACYLAASREINIVVRPVPQRRGGVKYAVDQLANPLTIYFRTGGSFGEGILIAGHMGVASDNPFSIELFQLFYKEARRQFSKIQSSYVGKEAVELFDKGWRLTAYSKSPTLYDLKRN